ncbi:unnamed protein product [Closterium sp. NIES-64]|nr:unnamed protein product [Closterium sp. NIES-64]
MWSFGGTLGIAAEASEKSPGEGTSTRRKGKDKSVGEGASTGRKGKEKAVNEGSSKVRKGKRKAEEEDEDVEEVEEVEQEEEEEGTGGGGGGGGGGGEGQGEEGSLASDTIPGATSKGGSARLSKVLMTELTGLDSAELERWKEVWEEVKICRQGCGRRCGPGYAPSKDTVHRRWSPRRAPASDMVPVDASNEEGREKSASMMSAMIGACQCAAAYGKTAAAAAKRRRQGEDGFGGMGVSSIRMRCVVLRRERRCQLTDAVEEGKSAAIIGGASQATADVFGKFMEAVLNAEMNRNRPLGEVFTTSCQHSEDCP